ncbi:hypothetical protein EAI_05007 [Harpegnathos saltator]|uniref:Uncharacterized protein n=1 Tax=Harpegnathos saltator TaxID=610380 RepID=E2BBP8_HARSA|nr:hypothetical protein EAI_05007 [Harpegnathos saltator]
MAPWCISNQSASPTELPICGKNVACNFDLKQKNQKATQKWEDLFPGEEFPPAEDEESSAGETPLRNAREGRVSGGRQGRHQWGLPPVPRPAAEAEREWDLAERALDGIDYIGIVRVDPSLRAAKGYGKPLEALNEHFRENLLCIKEALDDYKRQAREGDPDGRLGALEIQVRGLKSEIAPIGRLLEKLLPPAAAAAAGSGAHGICRCGSGLEVLEALAPGLMGKTYRNLMLISYTRAILQAFSFFIKLVSLHLLQSTSCASFLSRAASAPLPSRNSLRIVIISEYFALLADIDF